MLSSSYISCSSWTLVTYICGSQSCAQRLRQISINITTTRSTDQQALAIKSLNSMHRNSGPIHHCPALGLQGVGLLWSTLDNRKLSVVVCVSLESLCEAWVDLKSEEVASLRVAWAFHASVMKENEYCFLTSTDSKYNSATLNLPLTVWAFPADTH